jgi:hypothetical protein
MAGTFLSHHSKITGGYKKEITRDSFDNLRPLFVQVDTVEGCRTDKGHRLATTAPIQIKREQSAKGVTIARATLKPVRCSVLLDGIAANDYCPTGLMEASLSRVLFRPKWLVHGRHT